MSLLLSCPFFIYSVVVCYNMHSGYNFGEGGGEGKKSRQNPLLLLLLQLLFLHSQLVVGQCGREGRGEALHGRLMEE